MLWLALFASAEHFQSVRNLNENARGPANVEDKYAVPHPLDRSEVARRGRGEIIGTPAKKGSTVQQLLKSLPVGHGVTEARAAGVLARTKGDLGAAVEILLEDLELEEEEERVTSNGAIEMMLLSSKVSSQDVPVQLAQGSPIMAYRNTSPANSTGTISSGSATGSDSTAATRITALLSGDEDEVDRGSLARENSSGKSKL
jgi:OTU domain-containing protein 3